MENLPTHRPALWFLRGARRLEGRNLQTGHRARARTRPPSYPARWGHPRHARHERGKEPARPAPSRAQAERSVWGLFFECPDKSANSNGRGMRAGRVGRPAAPGGAWGVEKHLRASARGRWRVGPDFAGSGLTGQLIGNVTGASASRRELMQNRGAVSQVRINGYAAFPHVQWPDPIISTPDPGPPPPPAQ